LILLIIWTMFSLSGKGGMVGSLPTLPPVYHRIGRRKLAPGLNKITEIANEHIKLRSRLGTLQACDDGYEVDDVLRPVRRIFLVLGQQQLRGDVRRLGLPSPSVVAREPPPAAPLALVELRERVEPR
jgi:hypothetical protein